MTDFELKLLLIVEETTKKNPSMLRHIIDSATQGVRDFADNQSDKTAKASAMIISILENIPPPNSKKFGTFSVEEILDFLGNIIKDTPCEKNLKEKFK